MENRIIVHLLIDLHPNNNISDLVSSLKSASSRVLRQEFKSEIDKFYWGVKRNYGTTPNVSFPVVGHLCPLSKTIFKINQVAGSDSLLFPLSAPTASLSIPNVLHSATALSLLLHYETMGNFAKLVKRRPAKLPQSPSHTEFRSEKG
jgi:Transposase IS200 like